MRSVRAVFGVLGTGLLATFSVGRGAAATAPTPVYAAAPTPLDVPLRRYSLVRNTRQAFEPPNPKLFESTVRTVSSRPPPAT